MRRALTDLASRAGIDGHLNRYDLRHSAVSFMAAEGVPIEVARAILGHSDARLTMNVYRHVLGEERGQACRVERPRERGKAGD